VNIWRISRAVAICIFSTVATNAATTLYVQSPLIRKPMEQIASNHLTLPNMFLVLGALSGHTASCWRVGWMPARANSMAA
jgi:hypothetical protein